MPVLGEELAFSTLQYTAYFAELAVSISKGGVKSTWFIWSPFGSRSSSGISDLGDWLGHRTLPLRWTQRIRQPHVFLTGMVIGRGKVIHHYGSYKIPHAEHSRVIIPALYICLSLQVQSLDLTRLFLRSVRAEWERFIVHETRGLIAPLQSKLCRRIYQMTRFGSSGLSARLG